MAGYCIIVRRGEFELYDVLYKQFGTRVPVVWDRRRAKASPPGASEEHDADRRSGTPAPSWVALGFVVATMRNG